MKYPYVMIGVISVWLYVSLTLEYNNLLDIPMPVYGLVLAALVFGTHWLLSADYQRISPAVDTKMSVKTFIATIVGMTVAAALSLATSALINEENRAELSAPFTTCSRDQSQIKNTQVNREFKTSMATVTVYSVITNVAQSSKNPQPYSYKCQKATLIEVGIKNDTQPNRDTNVDFLLRDISLVTADNESGITADEIRSNSEFLAYVESKGLDTLTQSSIDRQGSARGWIEFSMADSEKGNLKSLVYDKYGENITLDLE